jgi:Raf kinase inhibitor-like YbhB/YbcL family protein
MSFILKSTAFEQEDNIPEIYTCKGENISPPLSWEEEPEGTKSFALVVEDPDTPIGTITHWIIYNIPPGKHELPERVPPLEILPDGEIQGKNGKMRNGYMGPCPPWGRHRYYFKVYALDTMLNPNPKLTKKQFIAAIENHVLDKAKLMGYYSKNE